MKRTLALLLLVVLVSTPAMAHAQASDTDKARAETAAPTNGDNELKAAAANAGRELVIADSKSRELAVASQDVPGRWGATSRTWIGVAMLAGGAAIIWKGVDIYQDEPDRFGRTKNSDSYLAWGVGGGIMTFGFITLKGGLEGRGF